MARSPRLTLWLLLAAALFMRAVLPQGVMPDARPDTLTVKLCSGGMMTMSLDRESAPAQDEQRAEPPCAFAGLGAPALPPPAVTELPRRDPVPLAFGRFAAAGPDPVVIRVLPPSRGPPPTA